MYSIGEFSRLTALTVKTLRHYHERGLLVPTVVDQKTGYRYYSQANAERARIIRALKQLEFSLDDIESILADCREDSDAMTFLEEQRQVIESKLLRYQEIRNTLDSVLAMEKAAKTMSNTFEVEEKTLAPQLIAGIRGRGPYSECADRFKQLGRAFGFGLAGKPGNLIFDTEYKEHDADFESYFPIKKSKQVAGIDVRTLPEVRVLSLVHQGPYDSIHVTYARLLSLLKSRGHSATIPSREVYIKGPGMIFKGNPKSYLTEVQIPIG